MLVTVEYTPQAYLQSDLNLFFNDFMPSIKNSSPKQVLIDNAVVQQTQQGFEFNSESDLDLEYAMTLVDPLQVTRKSHC
jgi:tripeptidyl-peptidase-1